MAEQKISEEDFKKVISNITRLITVIENIQYNQKLLVERIRLIEEEMGFVGNEIENFLGKSTLKKDKGSPSYIG